MNYLEAIDPEQVAYWYFRLNGCMTITNFMLHKKGGDGSHTDGDVVAVRFPHRQELDMVDADIFQADEKHQTYIQFFLVEVKFRTSTPEINDSWKKPYVIKEFLRRLGFVPEGELDNAVNALMQEGVCEYINHESQVWGRSLMIANSLVDPPTESMPMPIKQQLTWEEDIIPFMFDRLHSYKRIKSNHPQWDGLGHSLYNLAFRGNEKRFTDQVLNGMLRHRKYNHAVDLFLRNCETKIRMLSRQTRGFSFIDLLKSMLAENQQSFIDVLTTYRFVKQHHPVPHAYRSIEKKVSKMAHNQGYERIEDSTVQFMGITVQNVVYQKSKENINE